MEGCDRKEADCIVDRKSMEEVGVCKEREDASPGKDEISHRPWQ
jgi:hypothetical protein